MSDSSARPARPRRSLTGATRRRARWRRVITATIGERRSFRSFEEKRDGWVPVGRAGRAGARGGDRADVVRRPVVLPAVVPGVGRSGAHGQVVRAGAVPRLRDPRLLAAAVPGRAARDRPGHRPGRRGDLVAGRRPHLGDQAGASVAPVGDGNGPRPGPRLDRLPMPPPGAISSSPVYLPPTLEEYRH